MLLEKLQKKTLIPTQLLAYVLALFVGTVLLFSLLQFYIDIKPILRTESSVFDETTAVINKHVSLFKTTDKSKLYFTKKELDRLKKQPFIKDLAVFNYARFEIKAFTDGDGNIPEFSTDLFFESIPDNYITAKNNNWHWQEKDSLIPIIIPESYLKLYNFGFAESQGLPVFSKNTIQDFTFKIRLIGRGKTQVFKGKIIGFSSKINSILVPNNFLNWANKTFGKKQKQAVSRVLLAFTDPSDERIISFFNEHNYTISNEKLALGKMTFFFKSALVFVFFVALIILLLALGFVVLSIKLMLQKNKKTLQNLHSIGFSIKKLSFYYQKVILALTVFTLLLAALVASYLRHFYIIRLEELFDYDTPQSYIFIGFCLFLIILLPYYYFTIQKKIRLSTTS